MVESLQMFLFLFKSKYRRKCSWYSPFLCSVLIVLLFCHYVASRCSEQNCVNGLCKNETCVCFEGWQGPECQYCGGKIKLTAPSGIITDGPGNYSVSVQCTWLVEPEWTGPDPPPIRIRLESFATECGWDHLYVYDGDSVRAEKLLAVFSGIIQPSESAWTRQVVARSGSALLHFFSDDAFAMEGFNVTYRAYSCPSNDHYTNCSSHGECDDGTCRCESGWIGVACDQPLCPDDCNEEYGGGTCTERGCVCAASRAGADCGRDAALAGWSWLWRERGEDAAAGGGVAGAGWPPPAAGHVLLAYKDELLRVGGEMFGQADFLYRYNTITNQWSTVEATGSPDARVLHSAIIYNDELIVYGGVVATSEMRGGGLAGLEGRAGQVSNEVWRLQLGGGVAGGGGGGGVGGGVGAAWRNATPTACAAQRPPPLSHCGGLHVSGHTAVLAYIGPARKPVMLVFFGHSPHYGYLHIVQEYYIEEGAWAAATTRGWPARGGFGHSAVWDPLSRRVYVHGGLLSESEATQAPSAALHEYDVDNRVWRPLPSTPTPRYLHTATFVTPGVMLVFGGNAHNDSVTNPAGSRCYSGGAMLYDVRCSRWYMAPSPESSARAAHSATLLPGREPAPVVVHGGFDGRLRSDALLFTPGRDCGSLTTEHACLRHAPVAAVACAWRLRPPSCVAIADLGWKESFEDGYRACLKEPALDEHRCLSGESCAACTAAGCVWCGACMASSAFCPRHRHQMALSIEECALSAETARESCARFHSCAACHAHRDNDLHAIEDLGPRVCYWDYDTIKCRPANSTEDIRSVATAGPCSAPCSTFQTCSNCTAEECIWCASAARCVDKNAYGASFPLGGCRAWSSSGGVSTCAAWRGCAGHASCAACRGEPACGWCDDGAGGGRGVCLPGGARRPHAPQACPHHRWQFTECGACQCNGHAVCDAHARCIQPCAGRAVGERCEVCAPGHWGDPLNGGHCQPCECNAQAVSCAPDSGRCYCSTKGLAGERCDKCDNTNHYHADAYNKGACYYDLAVDYQFTFNLSKKEDRHLSAINFRNAPVKPDVDADFSITCSAHARLNLTVRTRSEPAERALFTHLNCTNFKYKFAKSEHLFGVEDNVTLTTFFVYVYDFKPPLWIQISFSQYPKLNLQQFFITFSSCFLLLLLVAAALWKIKQKYDLYRRRQRLFVEMEQMASRPFSQVCVELEKNAGGVGGGGVPAPVALEPCRGARAAVLSLLVRLPTGATGRAPPLGGLAVASALVTLGQHQPPLDKRPRHI